MISVVIPVFNEEQNLATLHGRLTPVLEKYGEYEILFVDDGSTDASADRLRELCLRDPRVVLLRFSRNFGHQIALSAGLEMTRGDCVITMDADLQHPPETIPLLIEKWREGFEVVYTQRDDAPRTPAFKRWTSRLFYRLMKRLADVDIPESAADFRLLDRKVVDALNRLEERTIFLRGLVSWVGFRQTGIGYQAEVRHAGQAKYSLVRMFRFALDGVVSFSSVPLRLATITGVTIAGCSFLYGVYVLWIRLFTGRAVPGWASIVIPLLFLGSVQLISIGIVGEYVARIFHESKHRPRYIVREIVRHEKS